MAEAGGFLAKTHLFPIIGNFFKAAKDKIYHIAGVFAKGGHEAAEMLAGHVPVRIKIAGQATKNLMEKAGKTVSSSKIAKETLAALQGRYKFVIEGIEKEILPEVARLNGNDIHHVLQEHHAWQKLVKDPKDWDAIARIMSKVLREGVERTDGIAIKSSLKIGNETVVVKFVRIDPEKTVRIGSAWVAK